jgi:RNA polymerase sigma factor (sigma-70 family)
MLKVKEGDIDKMGLLYERYHRKLYGFLFQMTRHKEISEDLTQHVFFRMLKYRNGFTGYGEFKTWMYHVARNSLHDHFRRNNRTPSHNSLQLNDFEEIISDGSLADVQLEKQQQFRILQAAMEKLSDENRELLVLCRFQELKYHEIARILNISVGAVKVRIHRALDQLKSNYLKIDYQTESYGMPRV